MSAASEFTFFKIKMEKNTAIIELNRPDAGNAMNWSFWIELPEIMHQIEENDDIRCVIFTGNGENFSIGLDIMDIGNRFEVINTAASAEERLLLHDLIQKMQMATNSVANCKKPVIAAVHKYCIGGGLDLISACDIRLCSQDALFSLREVKVAIVADMGSLQRLSYIIGDGILREMALTGRDMTADEALRVSLVNQVYTDKETLLSAARKMAARICKNPAPVVKGIKHVLNYSRDLKLEEALQYVITYNSAFLHTSDLKNVFERFKKLSERM